MYLILWKEILWFELLLMFVVIVSTGSFKEELNGYLQQTNSPTYQDWVKEAIEKEKMKQQHLKAVIGHLESEVGTLAQETVNRMENSMTHVCYV